MPPHQWVPKVPVPVDEVVVDPPDVSRKDKPIDWKPVGDIKGPPGPPGTPGPPGNLVEPVMLDLTLLFENGLL